MRLKTWAEVRADIWKGAIAGEWKVPLAFILGSLGGLGLAFLFVGRIFYDLGFPIDRSAFLLYLAFMQVGFWGYYVLTAFKLESIG